MAKDDFCYLNEEISNEDLIVKTFIISTWQNVTSIIITVHILWRHSKLPVLIPFLYYSMFGISDVTSIFSWFLRNLICFLSLSSSFFSFFLFLSLHLFLFYVFLFLSTPPPPPLSSYSSFSLSRILKKKWWIDMKTFLPHVFVGNLFFCKLSLKCDANCQNLFFRSNCINFVLNNFNCINLDT